MTNWNVNQNAHELTFVSLCFVINIEHVLLNVWNDKKKCSIPYISHSLITYEKGLIFLTLQWKDNPKKRVWIKKIPTKIDKVTSYQQLLRSTILPIAKPRELPCGKWQRFILYIYLGTFMRSNSLRIGFENTFEITKDICVKFKNSELWS